ncbi:MULTISPECIES: hypothetical protein [Bacillus]|uniref:hypothetical protein n=1 Tax=Bacillus TaxID=1386 RepID=UPI0011A1D471|nr:MULTISPECIES: hypothetical protein [Bacillus]
MLGYEKKVMTIDEMNAYREAYGEEIGKKEIFTTLVVPFMVCFGVVMILFYYWWLALIGGLLGSVYGYVVIMRNNAQRYYLDEARVQRNRFILNMTDLLMNSNQTVISSLKWNSEKILKGEFKEDVDELIARLMAGNTEQKRLAFDTFAEKYSSDFVFTLFINYLSIISEQGRVDSNQTTNLAEWHNEIMSETNELKKSKETFKKQFKLTTYYNLTVIAILTFAMGFNGYLLYYAHNPIGWVSSALVIGLSAFHFNSFQNRLMDDEVTEIKGWRRKKVRRSEG